MESKIKGCKIKGKQEEQEQEQDQLGLLHLFDMHCVLLIKSKTSQTKHNTTEQ
jgi:hypothetical protein